MNTSSDYFEFSSEPSASPEKSTAVAENLELRRLQYIVENTPVILYSSVPTGDFKMTYVSSNAKRILGYDPAMMVADPNFWFDHIHPDDIPGIFSSLALLFSEGERIYEYRFRDSRDQYVWMHDMLRLIRDDAGHPIEVVGSLTDISERKAMEEWLRVQDKEQKSLINRLQEAQNQLLQSEKMASIGQLAAGIAHEINNPIGFVNSNIGSLQNYLANLFQLIEHYEGLIQEAATVEQKHQRMQLIRKAADFDFLKDDIADLIRESMDGLKRVKDIVQSLKDFSHTGASDWQEADIHRGIESTLNIVYNEIKYKAEVVRQFGQIPLVRCAISQINQVVMNLLVNASHAVGKQGRITISTDCHDGWVRIAVQDNGVGIAQENLNRIFEPFFTTKPIGQGTGLGLSLSYGIIKKHRGRIEVKSEPGKGTLFEIFLPVNPDQLSEQTAVE